MNPMLTSEQGALLTAMVAHYNDNVAGRSLASILDEDLTLTLVGSMLVTMMKATGKEHLLVEVQGMLLQSVGIGVWLAEIGKTNLMKERRELQ